MLIGAFIAFGFNPCFNGSVERGEGASVNEVVKEAVSILVLMEVLREGKVSVQNPLSASSFNPCFNGSVERGPTAPRTKPSASCFNPCFNGSVERGDWRRSASERRHVCFNPCFNGSVERGPGGHRIWMVRWGFNPCFNGSVERGCTRILDRTP